MIKICPSRYVFNVIHFKGLFTANLGGIESALYSQIYQVKW
jgi:hypothetical protein